MFIFFMFFIYFVEKGSLFRSKGSEFCIGNGSGSVYRSASMESFEQISDSSGYDIPIDGRNP